MPATTRLLLPFTGDINIQALDCAIQLAVQRRATLVPLALIPLRDGRAMRLEQMQQAQDFLECIRRKAERRGVQTAPMRVFTHNVALSIEAVAGEQLCESAILFLCNTRDILLERPVICDLMERASCHLHIILLPPRRRRRAIGISLHISRWKYVDEPAFVDGLIFPSPEEERVDHSALERRLER